MILNFLHNAKPLCKTLKYCTTIINIDIIYYNRFSIVILRVTLKNIYCSVEYIIIISRRSLLIPLQNKIKINKNDRYEYLMHII